MTNSFPSIFGPNGNEPLDVETVADKFDKLTKVINNKLKVKLTPEQVALGFLNVANENMGRPIRNATEARGYATEDNNLVTYGGAGPRKVSIHFGTRLLTILEHACAIASSLGIKRIVIHNYSSVLSAYGIALAEVETEVSEPFSLTFSLNDLPQIRKRIQTLEERVKLDLVSQDIKESTIVYTTTLSLHYQGTETNLPIVTPDDEDYGKAFRETHLREFAFSLNKNILVSGIKVRGTGNVAEDSRSSLEVSFDEVESIKDKNTGVKPASIQRVYLENGWEEVPIYKVEHLPQGAKILVNCLAYHIPCILC